MASVLDASICGHPISFALEAAAAPTPAPPATSRPPDVCELPTIRGAGLSRDEMFRVNGARNRARAAYARDCSDASPGELDRVADRAATDELRRLLRDRPPAVAPALAVSAVNSVAAVDPGDVESDPSTWPEWTDNWF